MDPNKHVLFPGETVEVTARTNKPVMTENDAYLKAYNIARSGGATDAYLAAYEDFAGLERGTVPRPKIRQYDIRVAVVYNGSPAGPKPSAVAERIERLLMSSNPALSKDAKWQITRVAPKHTA